MSFESALAELETIVEKLEQGELPLEDALKQFERGISLVRENENKLQLAEQKIQILQNAEHGAEHAQLQDYEEY